MDYESMHQLHGTHIIFTMLQVFKTNYNVQYPLLYFPTSYFV